MEGKGKDMADNIENLLLEHLKKIQAELSAARERDKEIISRLAMIEEGVARIGRHESSNYSDIIHDRHVMDRLTERVERIERRLELNG
jgi:chromosome segregation ATPase